jgi:His-Xaa-Ser system protein HxsD
LKATFFQTDDEGLLAEVDLAIYSCAALLRVVHRFTDRCFVHLRSKSETIVEVRFRGKTSNSCLHSVAGEFCNELLDQTLREVVARESEAVRNLLLAHALSRTPLVEPELEAADPFSPPPSASHEGL